MEYGHAFYNKTKFIFIIQRPDIRLISWWNHFLKSGWINDLYNGFTTLEEYTLYMMNNKYNSCQPPPHVNHCTFSSSGTTLFNITSGRLSGISGGMYGFWIDNWMRTTSTKQIHISFLSNFQKDSESTNKNTKLLNATSNIMNFLQIHESRRKYNKMTYFPNKNRNKHYETLSMKALHKLNHFYKPWNCYLNKLIKNSNISHDKFPDWLHDSCL